VCYEDDQKALPIGWPPSVGSGLPSSTIWYLTLEPYLGRKFSTAWQTNKFCMPSSPTAAISDSLPTPKTTTLTRPISQIMSMRDILHPFDHYVRRDRWVRRGRLCGYRPVRGNVCYRHSGGNEHSVFSTLTVEGGAPGQKPTPGRANLVFLDTHVELRVMRRPMFLTRKRRCAATAIDGTLLEP